jgi:hypothetical protein
MRSGDKIENSLEQMGGQTLEFVAHAIHRPAKQIAILPIRVNAESAEGNSAQSEDMGRTIPYPQESRAQDASTYNGFPTAPQSPYRWLNI